MAYRSKVQALDAICSALGGDGEHERVVRALNEWAGLLGGGGGQSRNLVVLNEICLRLGGTGGHRRELAALNEVSLRLGGAGGHRRNLAALAEIAALAAAEEPVTDPAAPEPETVALAETLASLGGTPFGEAETAALDRFYASARGTTWWTKVRRLYVGGLHCREAGSIDLRDQTTTLTQVGTGGEVGWAARLGWSTGGASDRGLDMHANPTALTERDGIALFFWCPDYSSGSLSYDIRSADNSVRIFQNSGKLNAFLNQTSTVGMGAPGSNPGFRCASRTERNLTTGYDETGAPAGTTAIASGSPSAATLYMFAAGTGKTSPRSLLVAGLASGLTAEEVKALRDALAALGAAFWLS